MRREVNEALMEIWRVWGRETWTKAKVVWGKRGVRAQRAGLSGHVQDFAFISIFM